MNKKAISQLWAVLIQLVVVAVLLGTIYAVSVQTIRGTPFEQELNAIERSLVAESLSAHPNGILTIHTFSTIDYTTLLEEQYVEVRLPGKPSGLRSQVRLPKDIDVRESDMTGRGVRWIRSQQKLSLQRLTAQQECPLADFDFTEIAVIGENPLARSLQPVVDQSKYDLLTHKRLSQRGREPFIWARQHPEENNTLIMGAGDVNLRMGCLFANELQRAGIDIFVERELYDEPGVQILLKDTESTLILQTAAQRALEALEQ